MNEISCYSCRNGEQDEMDQLYIPVSSNRFGWGGGDKIPVHTHEKQRRMKVNFHEFCICALGGGVGEYWSD